MLKAGDICRYKYVEELPEKDRFISAYRDFALKAKTYNLVFQVVDGSHKVILIDGDLEKAGYLAGRSMGLCLDNLILVNSEKKKLKLGDLV